MKPKKIRGWAVLERNDIAFWSYTKVSDQYDIFKKKKDALIAKSEWEINCRNFYSVVPVEITILSKGREK